MRLLDLMGHSPGCLWAFGFVDLFFLTVGLILGAGITLLVYLFLEEWDVRNDETLSADLETLKHS